MTPPSSPFAVASPAATRGAARTVGAVLAFTLGLFLFWGVGFAQNDRLHNAAHDTRHANGFPCH